MMRKKRAPGIQGGLGKITETSDIDIEIRVVAKFQSPRKYRGPIKEPAEREPRFQTSP